LWWSPWCRRPVLANRPGPVTHGVEPPHSGGDAGLGPLGSFRGRLVQRCRATDPVGCDDQASIGLDVSQFERGISRPVDLQTVEFVGLTKAVALEYADRGVRVNAVAPGPTNTNIQSSMTGGVDPSELPFDTSAMSAVPMGRSADPEEVASAVAFLASDDASYVTGHTLPVDGGQAAD